MANVFRGGIIGCGYFGQIQLEAWRRMPEAEIVAACDVDIERARQSAPRAYSSAEEMLAREDLHFVDIATRPESHLALVELAASRKLAVICQKPMAPTWSEAVAMVRAAESAGIRLMIHENWRWQPWYREAQRLIQRGDIGQPVSYRFRFRKRDGAGAAPYAHQPYFRQMPRLLIYETLVHHIDTARFLFGDVTAVCAEGRRINPLIAGEDQALLIMTHASGLKGIIDGHRFAEPVPNGPALGDALFEGDAGILLVQATGDIYYGAERVWTNTIAEGYIGDCARATQQHFIQCLDSGERFESGAREYLKTFGAVEAAYESMARGCAVPAEQREP